MSSKLPASKDFKKWLTREVLPSIRKTGEYKLHKNVQQKIKLSIQTEADLHKAVVNHLRSKYPDLYFISTLGELQDTSAKRIDAYEKGYIKGSPDLLIIHKNRMYSGLAIEFKNPGGTGIVSVEQEHCLKSLKAQKFDVMISNDFPEIIIRIYEHINLNKIPKNRVKKTQTINIPVATILDYLLPKTK